MLESEKRDLEGKAEKFWHLHARIADAFSPGAPIDEKSLFAGRSGQVSRLIDAIYQKGQHVIIYGERGVGKTSLVNTFHEFLKSAVPVVTCRINCDRTDSYHTIWSKLLTKLVNAEHNVDLKRPFKQEIRDFTKSINAAFAPDDALRIMKRISLDVKFIGALDEIDRIEDKRATQLLADTIKALSDEIVTSKLILVGVADNVEDLISGHESIRRALAQIPMPRMYQPELEEIITKALSGLDMDISDDALYQIALFSRGLPHYTHLLGKHAAQHAAGDWRTNVDTDDIQPAIRLGVSEAQESIKKSYHTATASDRPNMYPDVLLACALAQVDEMGSFAASKVREPLKNIKKKDYNTPAFARHLEGLCKLDRDRILEKIGSPGRFRYRFRDPLMQPYIVLKAYSEDKIGWDLLKTLNWTFEVES